jgi:uncharacterized protein (TIGR02266 family)
MSAQGTALKAGETSERVHPPSGRGETVDARRAHARYPLELEIEITLESESNFYLGLTENFSEGGVFVATHVFKPIGTPVELSFRLPQVPDAIRVKGTVRWVRVYSESSDTPPGMGVRFDTVGDEHVALIRHFLASRAPLFFDED